MTTLGACFLGDGAPFVPGMLIYPLRPLGEPSAYRTDGWEVSLLPRWSGEGWEWCLFTAEGAEAGAAAIFRAEPVGIAPEGL